MIVHSIFFYIFSIIAIFSAIMVTVSRNTVHSVFFLILDFISISCLFIMIGAEFIGMIMLIVYVGAVAVLFLFVVMMLNVSIEEIKHQTRKYFLSGLLVGGVLLAELIFSFYNLDILYNKSENNSNLNNTEFSNTHQIGKIMYTDYFFIFQMSGCVLLVAMIGAIVLTIRKREGVLRQNISRQVSRKKADSIEIVKIKKN